MLLGTTAAVAYVSEAFVGAIEPLVEEVGVSELLIGVIVVPIVGNVAERLVGVQLAYKNNTDFSMAVSLGSSLLGRASRHPDPGLPRSPPRPSPGPGLHLPGARLLGRGGHGYRLYRPRWRIELA